MKVLLGFVAASFPAVFILSASIVEGFQSPGLKHSAASLSDVCTGPFSRHFVPLSAESSSASSSDADSALCLEGGGFLAVAVHTGLVTGLLRAAKMQGFSKSYDLKESDLLGSIKIIVSNSGGSWFASQLMYSDFVTLIEDMAKKSTASDVEDLFKRQYTQKWIDTFSSKLVKSYTRQYGVKKPSVGMKTQEWIDSLEVARVGDYTQQLIDLLEVELMDGTGGAVDLFTEGRSQEPKMREKRNSASLQDWNLFLHFFRSEEGLTWQNFAEELLTSTSSIKTTQKLGSTVKGWCEGKTWVISTSSVLPLEDSKMPSYTIWKDNFIPRRKTSAASTKTFAATTKEFAPTTKKLKFRFRPYVEYSSGLKRKDVPLNSLIPSRFSIVLGGVDSGISVLPVGLLKELELSYKGKRHWLPFLGSINAKAPQKGICEPQPQTQLSLISAVACSSAFLGGLPSTSLGSNVAAELKGDFAMWLAANKKADEAFGTARHLVAKLRKTEKISQVDLDSIADAGVYGIIDGGYTDNTGIINAVAAGATELFVWLDETKNSDLSGFLNLFQGGATTAPPTSFTDFVGDSFFFQIFSMSIQNAKSEVKKFKKLNYAKDTHIVDFRVGTITTETVANPIVGIKEEIRIKLHVVIVGSSLSIGYLEDFNDYASLVGQISEALQLESNKEIVNDMLQSLMNRSATFPAS